MNNFTDLKNSASPILESVYKLPFITELSNGTLPKETFIFYLQQDSFYLSQFSRALALTATKLDCSNEMKLMIELALGAIREEKNLHQRYFSHYQIDPNIPIQPTPTCFSYINFLLKSASLASPHEAVASLVPCFWVYQQVGNKIAETATTENNPYNHWIELYNSEGFELSVNEIVKVTNKLFDSSTEKLRANMYDAFMYAMKMEWMFWDSAYKLEQWQI